MFEQAWVRSGIATAAVLVIVLLIRQVVERSLRATPLPVEQRRRWTLVLRNFCIAAFVVGVGIIWEEQIRTLALSVLAVAAAFVLATKELISCAVGAILRTTTGKVSLGDRIEIKGMRGDVIDLGVLTTTIAEIGPGPSVHQSTGRIIVIPNSAFLTDAVFNDSFSDGYVFHSVAVRVGADEDWKRAEERLLEAARTEFEVYSERARKAILRASEGHNVEAPTIEPRTWIRLVDDDKKDIIVRFVTPTRARGRIEQAILRTYLETQTPPRGTETPEPTAEDA